MFFFIPNSIFINHKIIMGIDEANMYCPIYFYKLTDELKEFIIDQERLDFSLKINARCCLENLTLLKNEQVIYWNCTHDGEEGIDDKLKNKLIDYYYKLAKENPLFTIIENNYNILQKNKKFDKKEIEILSSIYAYIYRYNEYVFPKPNYDCSEKGYLNLIQKYMPLNIQNYFKKLTTFEEFEQYYKNIPYDFYLCLFYYRYFSTPDMQR